MSAWNGLDFFIFLITLVNTILGMSRGATKEIIALMCLCAALIFTIKFIVPLAAFFNKSPLVNDMLNNFMTKNFMEPIGAGPLTEKMLSQMFYCISMLICFVGVYGITSAVLVFSGFQEAFPFPYATLNRKVGGGLGFLRGYVISVLFILILIHIFNRENNSAMDNSFITNSFFYQVLCSTIKATDRIIYNQDPEKYREIFQGRSLYTPEELLKNVNELQPEFPKKNTEQNPSQ